MKTILYICLLILQITNVFAQEKGYVNDKDGYTNLRQNKSSSSPVIGILLEGKSFQYYPSTYSDWYRVNLKQKNAYVHKSKIKSYALIKAEINHFYSDFYNSDPNDAEHTASNNGKLFDLTLLYPLAAIDAYCEQREKIKNFLIKEYESPIHDMIDLELIYYRLTQIESTCSKDIHQAIKTAAKKIDENLGDQHTYLKTTTENNGTYNSYFISELDGKSITYYLNHNNIITEAKMYYSGEICASDDSITFKILDQLSASNKDEQPFYLYVFNSILNASDGALAEVMGGYCIDFMKTHPCEFSRLIDDPLYKKDFDSWINYMGLEYFYEENPIDVVTKDFETIKTKLDCKYEVNQLEIIERKIITCIDLIDF